jgi:hypothetical protein
LRWNLRSRNLTNPSSRGIGSCFSFSICTQRVFVINTRYKLTILFFSKIYFQIDVALLVGNVLYCQHITIYIGRSTSVRMYELNRLFLTVCLQECTARKHVTALNVGKAEASGICTLPNRQFFTPVLAAII